MKKVISIILMLAIFCNMFLVEVSALDDSINASSWAKDEINEAIKYDLLIDGLGKDFTRTITREEFCKLVVNMVEQATGDNLKSIENPFTDTTDTDIIKAYASEIVNGTSITTFSPNLNISRQEIAVMLIRAVRVIEDMTNDFFISDVTINEVMFADESKIASWAMQEVKLANKYGIMNGVGENKVNPTGNTTVEQAIILVKRLFEKQIIEETVANLDDSVEFISDSESAKFYSNVQEIIVDDRGNQVVTFDDLPEELENKNVGDIIFIEPSEDNPYGFIGKVESQITMNTNKVIFSTPFIDEVFEELEIHIDKNLNAGNIIAYDVPENVSLVAENENKIIPIETVASLGVCLMYEKGINSKFKERDAEVYGYADGLTKFKLGMNNAVIYDGDGNRNTIKDQVRLDGGITLENISIDGNIDIDKNKLNEISLVASIENVEFDLNAEFGIDEKYNMESILNRKTSNGYDLGFIAVEGVDMSNSLVVGSITFDMATLTPIPSTGEVAKLPLAAVVMLTVDLYGNINATVSASINYQAQVVKGISILDSKSSKQVDKGDESYVSENYNIDEYKLYKTKDNFKAEIKGDAHGELNFSLGPEIGLMIGGIMPVTVKEHGGFKGTFDGDAINIICDDGDWSLEGPGASIGIELGRYTTTSVRLMIELKGIPFVKSKHGFDYKWEDDKILWETELSLNKSFSVEKAYKDIRQIDDIVKKNKYLPYSEDKDAPPIDASSLGGYYDEHDTVKLIEEGYYASTGKRIIKYYYLDNCTYINVQDFSFTPIDPKPKLTSTTELFIVDDVIKEYTFDNLEDYYDELNYTNKSKEFYSVMKDEGKFVEGLRNGLENGSTKYEGMTFAEVTYLHGQDYKLMGYEGSVLLIYDNLGLTLGFNYDDSIQDYPNWDYIGIYNDAIVQFRL